VINTKNFYSLLNENGIHFYTGVPDSLLKNICAYITDNTSQENNIIAPNEGNAIALGAGYHLATGEIPLIYMQNSGIGNAINPILSLADKKVYSIPMLLMIGWRGEPGVKDEPQHITQGGVTLKLLDAMDIPYEIIPDDFEKARPIIKKSIEIIRQKCSPFAFVIRKNLFEPYKLQNKIETNFDMNREEAIKLIVDSLEEEDIIVSTTGKVSRELYEYRRVLEQGHNKDFLTVGSMGHASSIALEISVNKSNRNVFCLDGDGAAIMHLGSLTSIGQLAPKNFKHIILNNGAHESVGAQPTVGLDIDFCSIAKACGYNSTFSISDIKELENCITEYKKSKGPSLLEIKVNTDSRSGLGRPIKTPKENKDEFMKNLQ
jgi:phosphonopyruvate decarboxylase